MGNESTLNANAPSFVPSWARSTDSSISAIDSASASDDNDTEEAEAWLPQQDGLAEQWHGTEQWASYDQSFAYPPNTAMYAYPQQPRVTPMVECANTRCAGAARDESYVRASSIRGLKAIYRHACIKMGPYGALLRAPCAVLRALRAQ